MNWKTAHIENDTQTCSTESSSSVKFSNYRSVTYRNPVKQLDNVLYINKDYAVKKNTDQQYREDMSSIKRREATAFVIGFMLLPFAPFIIAMSYAREVSRKNHEIADIKKKGILAREDVARLEVLRKECAFLNAKLEHWNQLSFFWIFRNR